MRISLIPVVNRESTVISIISRKPGLYTGPIPEISKYIVPEKESEAYLVPHSLRLIEQFPTYLEMITRYSESKPVLIFNTGDFPRSQLKGNFIFLQNSIEKGSIYNLNRTVVLPYNVRMISTESRKKANFPTVSFVGQIPRLTVGRLVRSVFPLTPCPRTVVVPHPLKRNSALIRSLGVREIMKRGGIVIPRKFHGGSMAKVQDPRANRNLYEYVMNLSDFVFSPRGDANTSFRLYETISAGRLPVVPDTSTFLPNGVSLDFRDLMITTRASCRDMFQNIDVFWEGLTESDYFDKQRRLRDLFESQLKYENYMKRLFKLDLDELLETKPTLIPGPPG